VALTTIALTLQFQLDRFFPLFYRWPILTIVYHFGEYMKQLRNRYLKEDFEEDDENIRKDRFQQLNDTFLCIANIGYVQ
jgi:hypothetical protein